MIAGQPPPDALGARNFGLEVVVFYIEPTASITDARLEFGSVPFRCGQRQVNVDQLVIEVLTRGIE